MSRLEYELHAAPQTIETHLRSQLLQFDPDRTAITIPETLQDKVGLIAHRCSGKYVPGETRMAPENTLAAIYAAYLFGFRFVEFDVLYNVSAKKPLESFVGHSDDPLERTTDGVGSPFDKTSDELLTLDAGKYHSDLFAGTRIPTYAQMETMAHLLGITSFTELKVPRDEININDQDSKLSRQIGRRFAQEKLALHQQHNTKPSSVLSFSNKALEGISDVTSRIRLVRNIDYKEKFNKQNFPYWKKSLGDIGCSVIDPDSRLLIDPVSGLPDKEFIEQLQEEFEVMTYLSNNPGAIIQDEPVLIQRFINLGVSPITDLIHRVKPPALAVQYS